MPVFKHSFYLLYALLALLLLSSLARAQSSPTTYLHGQGLPPLVTVDSQGPSAATRRAVIVCKTSRRLLCVPRVLQTLG